MGNDCCKRTIVLTPKGEKYHNIIFFKYQNNDKYN